MDIYNDYKRKGLHLDYGKVESLMAFSSTQQSVRYILSEIIYRKIYRPDEPLIKEAEFMYEFMEHRAAIGEIEVIIALPENRDKWFQHFSKLCEEREEMYSTEKILEVYEEYLEHWKKLRYNKHVMRYDLFENMEGQNKNKVTDINDAK